MVPWPFLRVLGRLVALPVRRHAWLFERATHRPREIQEALLRRILAHQADTSFGREHGFAAIRTVADFRRQLPVSRYEYFEPYLDRVRRGELQALLADKCVHMFAMTSGTTAARKTIPVTPQYLADYKRGWNIWGLRAYQSHPEITLRPILQMSSDWNEFQTEAGIACGAVSGLTASMQKRVVRWVYCQPGCTSRIKDVNSKYYMALRLGLPKRRLGMLLAANPSSLINLARFGDQEKETLIRDIHDGGVNPSVPVPAKVRQALARRLGRDPVRARELEEIVRRTGNLYPRDYWPSDCLIGNWTGGSVGAYLRHYPRYFGTMKVRDIGLLASEGRMTIPLEDGTTSGVLDITSHYFEFLPEEEADSPRPAVVSAHEVEEGRKYFILPTTAFGLYRYHIFDLVRVTGFHNRTPLIEFLSKGSHFANITGEKLSEYHVARAMQDVLADLDLTLTSYSLAPCWHDELPYYGLFVERGDLRDPEQGIRLAEALDRCLGEVNEEYDAKRRTLRLGAIRLLLLSTGAWQEWDRRRLARTGGTLEQYKHPCLISDPKFRETIAIEEELAPASEPAR